jgi:DNA polymerase-4
VGRRTRRILEDLNIRTIGALALLPVSLLEAAFGLNGRKIAERARGVDRQGVEERALPLSLSRETTFPRETSRRGEVESMLHYLTERAAAHLREKGLTASAVEVKLRYADFRGEARRRALPRGPSDQVRVLFPAALKILNGLLTRRVRVRLVGVTLLSLKRRTPRRQRILPLPALFDPALDEDLYAGIDRIRGRFGFGALTAGRSIEMLGKVRRDAHGFILRTPSLTR